MSWLLLRASGVLGLGSGYDGYAIPADIYALAQAPVREVSAKFIGRSVTANGNEERFSQRYNYVVRGVSVSAGLVRPVRQQGTFLTGSPHYEERASTWRASLGGMHLAVCMWRHIC